MSQSTEEIRTAARALAEEVGRASRQHLPVIGRAARQVAQEEGPRIAGAVRRLLDDLRRKRV